MTVMVIGRRQQGNQRDTMSGFGVDCRKGVHSVAHDINGLVSFFPTLPAIAVNIIVNADILSFDL